MTARERALIYYRKDSAAAKTAASRVGEWMIAKGFEIVALEAGDALSDEVWEARVAIVLGGDGTVLGLARKLAGTEIPIFGINFGKVGFLTSSEAGDWEKGLLKMLNGELKIRRYMALKWRIFRDGQVLKSGVCANDLVLSRCYPAKLVAIEISVNGREMGVLRGDGVVVCAPLGSTGYCASAGGPIIFSGMNAMGVAPVCPFPLGAAPLVMPGETRLELKARASASDCYCTLDGQECVKLRDGDITSVSGWQNALSFYGDESLFFSHLKERGFALES